MLNLIHLLQALDTYKSSISDNYLRPIEALKSLVKERSNTTNKQFELQRMKIAQDKINKGFIIPIFNDENLPCVVKEKVKGKDAYNAISSAISNTKNDYLIRDDNGELLWFRNYSREDDTVTFSDSVNGQYVAFMDDKGEVICDEDNKTISEIVRRIVRQILKENRYGL